MIITKQWIHDHKTPAGAWNRKQIEALGLSWPATKGWIKSLEGKEVTLEQKMDFEFYGAANLETPMQSMERRIRQIEFELKILRATI